MATFKDSDWKMLKAETALLMITSGHESLHCFTQVSVAPNAEPSVLSSWTPSTLSLCSRAMPHCTKHHSIVISYTNGPLQYCLHPQNCASNWTGSIKEHFIGNRKVIICLWTVSYHLTDVHIRNSLQHKSNVWMFTVYSLGIFHTKMNILLSFNHHHIISNLNGFLSSAEPKRW